MMELPTELPDQYQITGLLDYNPQKIMSAVIFKEEDCRIHLMALSEHQSIPMHSTKKNAFLLVLEGEAILTIGKRLYDLTPGVSIELPGKIPHAIKAITNFKMIIVK